MSSITMTTDQKICVCISNVLSSCGQSTNYTVSWSSTNPSVASVTDGGLGCVAIRGLTNGTTTIIATITPQGGTPFQQSFPVNVTSIGNPQSNNLTCGSFSPLSIGENVGKTNNISCGSINPIGSTGQPFGTANNNSCGSISPIGSIGFNYPFTTSQPCFSVLP